MRVLVSWLEDFIEWTGRPRELAGVLTDVSFPVPRIEELAPDDASFGDSILDVEVTSNRGDCLSHLGIAREVAAATGQACRPVVHPAEPREEGSVLASSLVQVAVEVPELCPAYVARALVEVDGSRPTPPWVARRLAALGVRAVHPIVDITNFILLARGQPLHAFDRAKLRGGRIVVRLSRAGETLETLDGKLRRLPAGLLVIADAERPVAVAGVMGGRDTEVGPSTREVILESARFAPAAVRASAAALGLATEASARFSRRIDPAEVEIASLRALAVAVDGGCGVAARGSVPAGPAAREAPRGATIRLRHARLARVLGVAVHPDEVGAIFAGLRVEVLASDREGVTVRAPTHRGDLRIEEDLVEEVARMRGYALLPSVLSLPVRPVPVPPERRAVERARDALAGAGWREALTLPFTAGNPVDDASPWTDRPAIRVDNPVRDEEPLLRRSLLGPLLRCLERNRSRGVDGVRLFEIGAVFLPAAEGGRPEERRRVAGVVEGEYADARGAVDAVAAALGHDGRLVPESAPEGTAPRPLDPVRTARFLRDGRIVAWAGEVRGADLQDLGVHREGLRAAAFEIDLEALLDGAILDPPVAPVPAHPLLRRDLAVVFPDAVRWGDVEACARGAAGEHLRSVELFDEFRGGNLPAGTRSLAFRLVFGSAERTLRGEEADGAVAAVVAALEGGLGGRLRR